MRKRGRENGQAQKQPRGASVVSQHCLIGDTHQAPLFCNQLLSFSSPLSAPLAAGVPLALGLLDAVAAELRERCVNVILGWKAFRVGTCKAAKAVRVITPTLCNPSICSPVGLAALVVRSVVLQITNTA